MIEFGVAGIIKEGERNHILRRQRPTGMVKFVAEPENPYDSNAVMVMYNDIKLGYVPMSKVGFKGSYQEMALKAKVGEIIRYSYTPDHGKTWNTEHDGMLGSVRLSIAMEDEDTFSPPIGARYVRISALLNFLNLGGGFDGIIKWAFDQGGTHKDYVRAIGDAQNNGTEMHEAIEAKLMGYDTEYADCEPEGLDNWIEKHQPESLETEVRIRDNDISVTGQYDWLGYITYKGVRHLAIVDWKSSKSVKPHHKIQASFYAKNANSMERPTLAVVVAFGSDAKQGYSMSVVEADDIEANYQGIVLLKRALDMFNVKFSLGDCI